jgi:hypothetical protein
MTDNDTVIGIDFITTDSNGGVYGLYESVDGGAHWKKLTESRIIYNLIEFAKDQYSSTTPMVVSHAIQQLLQYEILTEREKHKLLALHKPTKQSTNWFKKLVNWLMRRDS